LRRFLLRRRRLDWGEENPGGGFQEGVWGEGKDHTTVNTFNVSSTRDVLVKPNTTNTTSFYTHYIQQLEQKNVGSAEPVVR
jgi:hypothetical protein